MSAPDQLLETAKTIIFMVRDEVKAEPTDSPLQARLVGGLEQINQMISDALALYWDLELARLNAERDPEHPTEPAISDREAAGPGWTQA